MVQDTLDSETFHLMTDDWGINSDYENPALICMSSSSSLYRVNKSGRYFVLKTPRGTAQNSIELLQREYELTLALSHPNIINIYGYKAKTVVGPAIVMEYVDGRNLREYLSENPSSENKMRVFMQILDAVEYIHKVGLTHNDLKPENILITYRGNNVKLIDFGLADNDAHYLSQVLGGTPAYASPELLRQEGTLDARSDIYSIGWLMKDLLHRKYRTLSDKCLQKDREKRFSTIDALKRAMMRKRFYKSLWISICVVFIVLFLNIELTYVILNNRNQKVMQEKERLWQEDLETVYERRLLNEYEIAFAWVEKESDKAKCDEIIRNFSVKVDNMCDELRRLLKHDEEAELIIRRLRYMEEKYVEWLSREK